MTEDEAREVLEVYTSDEAITIGPQEAHRRTHVAICDLLDQLYHYWPNAVDAWISAKRPPSG